METEVLHRALNDLPGQLRGGPSASQVKQLAKLVEGDLPLQSFLEQLLPQLCGLFTASAAVVWMKAHGARGAVFGVRFKMDQLLNTVAEQQKHERLVQLAWQQKQPMLAEPTVSRSRGKREEADSADQNPTGRPLLFGPVLHMGETIALLEIVLDETSEPLPQPQRQLYLRSVQLIAERVYGGLRQRMSMPAASAQHAAAQLEQLAGEIDAIQQQIRRSLENRLQQFHGWAFASLSENQSFAKSVHKLLDQHGFRVQCPECGHPAILRCLRAGNAKNGAFVFDHYLEGGRTFHGGPTTVPLIRVVNKPARRAALPSSA